MGPRWDPATQACHGRPIAAQRAFPERRFGLATKVVVPKEAIDQLVPKLTEPLLTVR